MVTKGKMVAEFETMLRDNLEEENAKNPEVKKKEQEKRQEKKALRKERERVEKGEEGGGELVQSGKTKRTGKKLREKRLASAHSGAGSGANSGMSEEETWRSWLERNMSTEKEKNDFINEHMKGKETFIDLDQRIGESNADFRVRKRQETAL